MASETLSDVGRWLGDLDLGKYRHLFEQQSIGFDVLAELTDQDLKAIGVGVGDRKRLLKAINSLQRSIGATLASSPEPTPKGARESRKPEHRQITVLFSDLVDSSTLANTLNAEDLAELYRAYRKCIEASVARWGGHVARFYGDGALLYFGWPVARENDSERAIRVGLDIVAAVARLPPGAAGQPLAARVGVATGMVMIGELIGEGFAREESIVGPVPNLAARLQSLADPGTVLMASSTYHLVGEAFACTPRDPVIVKGFPGMIEVWQPCRTIENARFQRRLAQRLTPLAGREPELKALYEFWQQAAGGNGCSVVITGDAGIGKSRLVHGLGERLARMPHAELHWQCSPFHVDSALRPAIQAMHAPAGIAFDDPPEAAQEKAHALLAAFGFDRGSIAAEVRTLFPTAGDIDLPGAAVQLHDVVDLVAQFAFRLAIPGPLLMVVEDIHWADPSTLAAIARILAGLATRNLLLILTVRREADPPQIPWAAAARIDLAGVGAATARSMVRQIVGENGLSETVFEAIVATTGGVPLYIEETSRMLLASGQLSNDDQIENGLKLAIPATLRELLVARLDSLNSDKTIAQIAATIGRPFSEALLSHLVDEPERMLGALARLCEARILERQGTADDPVYAFHHGLLQEAAYRSQLRLGLRELHARIAVTLEDHFPDEAHSSPEFLAYHFAKADLPEPAARNFLAAGRQALRLAATREAIANFEKGLAVLAKLPSSAAREQLEMRLQASRGTALMTSKSWAAAEAEAALGAATALSHASNDPHETIWVLWGVFVRHQVRGDVVAATAAAERICTAAPPGHTLSLLVAEMVSLQVSFYAGRFGDALTHCAGFAKYFDPPAHRSLANFYTIDLELVAKIHQAVAEWILGRPGQAFVLSRQAKELARSTGHLYSIAWMLTWGSMVYLLRDDLYALKSHVDEGIALADGNGFSYMGALGRMMRGWCVGRGGNLVEGITEMQEGIDAFQATGAEIAIPFFRILLAQLFDASDQKPEALGQLDAAEAQIALRGERWAEAELHRVRGEILSSGLMSERRGAIRSYRRALAIARAQGAHGWRIRVRNDLAHGLSARRASVSCK